jgi:hydrogenase maturation protein HypF
MAENHLDGEVIGVAFDGTGYGTDGAIWGGEFLTARYGGFERRAHLRYVPLAGGDAAVREPWRAGLAYLMDALGPDAALAGVPEPRLAAVRRMIATGFNTIPTSSCGRLFDAVAAIAGLRCEVNFEAQAAIELEHIADPQCRDRYPFEIAEADCLEIDFRPAIAALAREKADGCPVSRIAAKFHNTLAEVVAETCRKIRAHTGLGRVCLSGGSFQNMRLLAGAVEALRGSGFEVFVHALVPPNDGGLALGQAAVAAGLMR